MKELMVALMLMPMMALVATASDKESGRDIAGGDARYSIAKSALKFSSDTRKLAKTPAKAMLGKSFSLNLGITSSTRITKVTAAKSRFFYENLPAGLSIDKKTGKITGTPASSGKFTVKVTAKDASGNKVTQKVKITVYVPKSVRGTYYGYTGRKNSYENRYMPREDSLEVKVTVSSIGKVSAKVGTISLTGGLWLLTKKGRTYNNRYHLYASKKFNDYFFWVVDCEINPNADWRKDSLTGRYTASIAACCADSYIAPKLPRTNKIRARKNATATNATAKKLAAKCAKIGTQTMGVRVGDYKPDVYGDYDLTCPKCTDADYFRGREKVYVKTDKNGIATLSGSIAGTRVSGTTYLEYTQVANEIGARPFARFFCGNFVVEIEYYVSQQLSITDSDGNTLGRAWKRK